MSGRKVKKDVFVNATREWFGKYAGYRSLDDARAVVGISGGKDSSVVAALLKEALGAENVLGVTMPNHAQVDMQDSLDLLDHLGIYRCGVNIGGAYNSLLEWLGGAFVTEEETYGLAVPIKDDKAVTTNLPARLRMATLYAIANHENRRVIGTGNKAEILCGYYTLWGDGACDFDPIADLYVDEVIELGRQLGVPDRFLLKTPDDGMSGVPDETKLGFLYSDVKVLCESPYITAKSKLGEDKYNRIWDRINSTGYKRFLSRVPHISIRGSLKNLYCRGYYG